ncbi:MAG: DinB family protein [Hyphomicrobiaceae bacterium]
MITPAHMQTMARYNRWQNQSIYGAADRLPDAERRQDKGAFFKSIHGTLSHLLYGDMQWMSRFAGTPEASVSSIAESPAMVADWDDLKSQRAAFDEVILRWTQGLDAGWLQGDLTWYSGSLGKDVARPKWLLVTHMFNHQTHHRGQVHCMLTQSGIAPGVTDLAFMPD